MADSTRQREVPPPGALALVDLAEGRAGVVMQAVRQRVATLADPAIAMRRAIDAAETADRLLAARAMGSMLAMRGDGAARVADRLPTERPLWIVGDVRGDALALGIALAFIDEADPGEQRAAVAFLGDWTGGTAGDAACTTLVLERFNAAPDRTLLLRGDREWVGPAACAAPPGLRAMPHPPVHARLHAELCEAMEAIASKLPALVVLPEGVALAHGALPRASRLKDHASLEALGASDAAMRDCTLGRVHLREMRAQSGEREGGLLLGVEDFAESVARLSAIVGREVNRLVRGQDAAPEGFRWFKAYGAGALLTLTTMADPLPDTAGGGRRSPCLGRLKSGRIRVVRLQVPAETAMLGDQLFPRIAASSMPEPTPVPTHVTDASFVSNESPRPFTPEPAPVSVTAAPRADRRPSSEPDPASSARRGPDAARIQFERGVRLLQARAWAGARDAFRNAAESEELHDACALNESVACLWLGTQGHQQALARLRMLRQTDPRDAAVLLNLGIAFLAGERNPSEALRTLRAAVDADAELFDAWWGLGLAAAMRSDRVTAAAAFTRAADGGCLLPVPGSLHGLIPARELDAALEALRGLARHRPTPDAPPVPLHA